MAAQIVEKKITQNVGYVDVTFFLEGPILHRWCKLVDEDLDGLRGSSMAIEARRTGHVVFLRSTDDYAEESMKIVEQAITSANAIEKSGRE